MQNISSVQYPAKPTSPKPAVTCTNSPSLPTDERPSSMGTKLIRSGEFRRSSEIERLRLQFVPFVGYPNGLSGVSLLHIQNVGLIHHEFIGQGEIVAVRIQPGRIERLDDEVSSDSLVDHLSRQNHDMVPRCVCKCDMRRESAKERDGLSKLII